ncbi:response regulator [Caulobacter segnis]|uniref:response regulator n=1 Tax=Caulobacter segnis TaxID=88688 RepID=UPI001CBD27C5|nr:response regulator [Caulobacter segnis]UAL09978.1 response regulator [Caulobacter segnis]
MSTPAVQFPPTPVPVDRPRAKVLIVDDDERNAFAATQALEALGQELVVARSGPEALRKLLTDDFAVILLDLHMPGMDGYETAALIRERRRTRDVPIVFLTAVFRDEGHIFKAYSAGAVDVVFKPVDPFILRSKVQVLVDLHIKRLELARELESRQRLLEEHARVQAEKLEAERSLQASLRRQQAIQRALPIVFYSRMADPPYAALSVSDSIKGLTGYDSADFTDDPDFGYGHVHPDDQRIVQRAQEEARRAGSYTCEYRWLCADGTYKSLIDQGILGEDPDTGAAVVFGTLLDNTERRALEEALGHARKMETVGQLTGGVAHDFNNLLTVILGNVDLIQRRCGEGFPLARQVKAIRQATERGAALTRQLLAFSRRQRLDPAAVDLNELVRDFTPLIRQAVGDAVSVSLEPADAPAFVHVDPAQMESALLNLAVNARDAMDGAGGVTIAIRSAPGGVHRLIVRDTGPGMAPDVASRIFEPFFTTKDVGKGSGLGLSQVYGFVQQSGGEVTVVTALGEGAAFEITLPAIEAPTTTQASPSAPSEEATGSEHILVVEDDPSVLALAVDTLESLGYRVTTARNAASALRRLKGSQAFEMLFSDVVMPGGVSGLDLARRARGANPGLKVLLTSGFIGEEAIDWADEYPMLDKPYDSPSLAAKVRSVLDA